MTDKGFTEIQSNIGTPIQDDSLAEKPSKSQGIKSGRVDINILKSKLQAADNKEFKKNIYILSTLILILAVLGIYLSL